MDPSSKEESACVRMKRPSLPARRPSAGARLGRWVSFFAVGTRRPLYCESGELPRLRTHRDEGHIGGPFVGGLGTYAVSLSSPSLPIIRLLPHGWQSVPARSC